EGKSGNPELNVGSRSSILYPKDTGLEEIFTERNVISDFINLKPNQFLSSIAGVVTRIFPVNEFSKSDGSISQVRSLILKGEKGSIRIVVWGDMAYDLDDVEIGFVIQFNNVYVRESRDGGLEIHTSPTTSFTLKPEIEINVEITSTNGPTPIGELSAHMFDVEVVGKVISIFDETFFERADETKGSVKSLIIGDPSGNIRVSFWNDKINEIRHVKEGDIIRIKHGYTRSSPFGLNLNVGSKSEIEINPEGVSLPTFKQQPIKISEIIENQFNISVAGRVLSISEIRDFDRTDGSKGRVQSLFLGDETGSIRVVVWNDKIIDVLADVKVGDIILIKGGYSKEGLNDTVELHIGNLANIEINPSDIVLPEIEELTKSFNAPSFKRANISDLKPQDRVEIMGTIVYVFSKNIVYPACPNCFKKAEFTDGAWVCNNCGEIDKVDYRMILSVTLDDGSGTIRANLMGGVAEELLGLTAEEAHSLLESGKEQELNSRVQALIAKTFLFRGKVFFSDFSQDNELNVSEVKKVDVEKEVKTLLDSFNG
ncbi:MAG: OB-fold nucleic acid binding domain-containing protein, partial [Candidatus Odinarchaeia archaeon]